jgi:5'-nucleotidase
MDEAVASRSSELSFIIVQLNDVYEIAPVEGGRRGGLARVATLRKELLKETPHVLTVMSGDFLSPSAMGATKIGGEPIGGAQMVASLNAMGLDYAGFGNHEFDGNQAQLEARIKESRFGWIASNVTSGTGQLFPGTMRRKVLELRGPDGRRVRLGLLGICTDMVKKPWVRYEDKTEAARRESAALAAESDVVVALTHLPIAEDKALAAAVPRLDVLLGGHEHESTAVVAGADATPIYKADANARTVYVHRFHFDVETKKLRLTSQLTEIDQTIPEDPAVKQVVEAWKTKVFATLRAGGVDPEQVVGNAREPLDGFESSVRNRPTTLTRLIAEAFHAADPAAEATVYAAGAIRLDDRLVPGPITQYDLVRIFPFGGTLGLVEIKGELLIKALEQGERNRGAGGFLQYHRLSRRPSDQAWLIGGRPIEPKRQYKVLFADFLLTGQERGLPFLKADAPGGQVRKLRDTRPVRELLATYLGRAAARPASSASP